MRPMLLLLLASAAVLPVPKVGACPGGYVESGGFCSPMAGTQRPAIAKGKGQCPANWTSSGAYCLGPETRK